jgi:hypothetical protein
MKCKTSMKVTLLMGLLLIPTGIFVGNMGLLGSGAVLFTIGLGAVSVL